ncbi:MAG: aminoacyl-tRNA hydrolase [Actinomycetota bacterium]|nr:aminoacyl-tRNA hydrolase [Actinomycetota bacterium]MDH5224262.1 aminoacyl-tRNA hydrolase [Actinomycetota bacterium]MDH5313106.1 aminoacyl-tRNA hydrolase [Actinomycetota bacterium]
MTWLVAGLGNPGDRYANTRHNVGRMVIDELARRSSERFRKVRFLPAEVAEIRAGGERVLLAASTRFMNESGPTYASLGKKHDVDPDRVIAVYDELDITAGELRVKLGGGSSHNGVKSLQQALRSRDFLHVRIGIGRPPGRQDPADFVLEPVGKKLGADLAVWVDRAADAVLSLIVDGLASTQDRFNRQSP